MRCLKKQARPQFSKYRFQNESAWGHSLWPNADSIWSQYSENYDCACFFKHRIILLKDPILSHSPNFGRPKQGQKFVVPTFHIHFLNPECVRISWVLAPKKISHWKLSGTERFTKKVLFFTDFSCRLQKKVSGLCTQNFDDVDLPNS